MKKPPPTPIGILEDRGCYRLEIGGKPIGPWLVDLASIQFLKQWFTLVRPEFEDMILDMRVQLNIEEAMGLYPKAIALPSPEAGVTPAEASPAPAALVAAPPVSPDHPAIDADSGRQWREQLDLAMKKANG